MGGDGSVQAAIRKEAEKQRDRTEDSAGGRSSNLQETNNKSTHQ